ncbi:MAG: 2-amino-4-hydroxy-6-hydroxymethyldihydropteridine pyrophosphokinae FolK [Pseudomonadota bacterium]
MSPRGTEGVPAAPGDGRMAAWIALGANLGDAPATLRRARAALAERAASDGRVPASSGLWRSAPVDAGGPDFHNAVLVLDTALAPLDLLDLLQAIEAEHGRDRPYRNAPRTLDLDLLWHGGAVRLDSPRLILPHPRLHQRAFVLRPLLELDPPWALDDGRAVADALADVADQRITRTAGADWMPLA